MFPFGITYISVLTEKFRKFIIFGMKLTPIAERFILHWGEMGTKWGINRTVAQIHALLFFYARLKFWNSSLILIIDCFQWVCVYVLYYIYFRVGGKIQ